VTGWHLDVGEHEVRAPRVDEAQQLGRVTCFADDVESRLGEQLHEPLTQQSLVVGD
jgi:hypothetical protein